MGYEFLASPRRSSGTILSGTSGGFSGGFVRSGASPSHSKDGVSGNDSLYCGTGTDTKETDATEKSIVGFP